MATASVIAVIALAGVVFMLRFLIALLRECTLSVSDGMVPARQKVVGEKLVPVKWRSLREREKEREIELLRLLSQNRVPAARSSYTIAPSLQPGSRG
jgi:hypothetical protein